MKSIITWILFFIWATPFCMLGILGIYIFIKKIISMKPREVLSNIIDWLEYNFTVIVITLWCIIFMVWLVLVVSGD